jgi:hypothetical protein
VYVTQVPVSGQLSLQTLMVDANFVLSKTYVVLLWPILIVWQGTDVKFLI